MKRRSPVLPIMRKIFFMFLLLNISLFGQENKNGAVNGTVIDGETQMPLTGTSVTLIELNLTENSGQDGKFGFRDLPLGTYRIRASKFGYEAVVKTDIVVLSSRPSEVIVELNPLSYVTETIEVEAKYFQRSSEKNTSIFNLDFEEVRRAPGAVEDISRMVQVLPGVAPGNDQRNDLIVRGGSPSENLIIIDGIEVPNINHYPTQGSTGGPIGMINVKFIQNVDFSTGGFSARFGDKLSSVMEIKFREGYKKKWLSDINLSTAGFGGVFEGPLFSNNGSFILSARRSYLNLIRGAIRLSAVPNYWDFNLKAVYDLDRSNRLSVVGVGGLDEISFEGNASEISDDNPYGKARGDQQQFTAGLNLRTLFKDGFVQTVFSNSSNFYFYDNYDIRTNDLLFDYHSSESEFNLKSEVLFQLSKVSNLSFGAGAKYIKFKNNLFIAADTSYFGDPLPELRIDVKDNFYKAFAFTQYTLKFLEGKLLLNTGLRFDYFSGITEKNAVSPRAGVSLWLTPVTVISASTGVYYQSPEYLWVTSDPWNVNLEYLRSYHYVLGIEHLLSDDLRFTLEGYYKKYDNYPVSFYIPTYILVAGGAENGPNFVGKAISGGYGYVRGVDLSLHKKLSGSGFYGMLNYSLSESRFTALQGGEKPGSFDYRHNLTLIAGYQISNEWLIGVKYRFTSGRPYTPFDVEASTIAGRGIYKTNSFNEARFKDYSRLDIRVDKQWNFRKLSIVAYAELQNLLNTANVYQYFWNEYKNEVGTIYQWAFLPVGGISVQF